MGGARARKREGYRQEYDTGDSTRLRVLPFTSSGYHSTRLVYDTCRCYFAVYAMRPPSTDNNAKDEDPKNIGRSGCHSETTRIRT